MGVADRQSMWVKYHYRPRLDKPLCFTAEEPGVQVNLHRKSGTPPDVSIETSYDGESWSPYTTNTTIFLNNVGDRVFWRAGAGGNTAFGGYNSYHTFDGNGKKYSVHGNIMSLLDANNLDNKTLPANYTFKYLFQYAPITSAPLLPATTLTTGCYNCMFSGCSYLKQAPELPATTLVSTCYKYMFNECAALIHVRANFTSWSVYESTYGWLRNVSSSGTLLCPAALGTEETIERGQDRCPDGWAVVNI